MWDQPAAVLEPAISEDQQQREILIIEDDESQREVLSLRLRSQGFRTLQAGTAMDGLRLAEERHPHLVLLDVRLPDIDGFRVCRHLEENPGTSVTVAMSASCGV